MGFVKVSDVMQYREIVCLPYILNCLNVNCCVMFPLKVNGLLVSKPFFSFSRFYGANSLSEASNRDGVSTLLNYWYIDIYLRSKAEANFPRS